MNRVRLIYEHLKQWSPLTEFPSSCCQKDAATGETLPAPATSRPPEPTVIPGHPVGIYTALLKFLWDIVCSPYSTVTERIKRLGISGRDFENLKHEAQDKGYILESSAGNLTFLIPMVKAYQVFNMTSPFGEKPEHSYYIGMGVFNLEKNLTNRHVYPNHPIGNGNMIGDIATVDLDGRLTAFEITLSTSNILSNAAKYANTAFAKVVFLCRDYKLREAVRACCQQGGLDPKLLSRIDYEHMSAFLKCHRKLSF